MHFACIVLFHDRRYISASLARAGLGSNLVLLPLRRQMAVIRNGRALSITSFRVWQPSDGLTPWLKPGDCAVGTFNCRLCSHHRYQDLAHPQDLQRLTLEARLESRNKRLTAAHLSWNAHACPRCKQQKCSQSHPCLILPRHRPSLCYHKFFR